MKDRTKKFAIGTIFAAIGGYIAGILTAPKSGKETREDIKNAAVKAKTEAEKKLKVLHSELDELIAKSKATAKSLQKSGAKELDSIVGKAQQAREKVRQILSGIHEGDASDKDLKKAIDEAAKAVTHLKTFLVKNDSTKKDS